MLGKAWCCYNATNILLKVFLEALIVAHNIAFSAMLLLSGGTATEKHITQRYDECPCYEPHWSN